MILSFGCKIIIKVSVIYLLSWTWQRFWLNITPCNNNYITCITLVIEIPSTPYLVYSSCHCYASEEISGHPKMLSCIHPWLHVQFSYKPVTGNAHFFRPCTFRHVRSVFMAILTFLTIIDYSWQQRIGFEHFIDSFYDRNRIFPTVQKMPGREGHCITKWWQNICIFLCLIQNVHWIPSLMQMTHCWGASAVCINITVLSNEDVKMSIISL